MLRRSFVADLSGYTGAAVLVIGQRYRSFSGAASTREWGIEREMEQQVRMDITLLDCTCTTVSY
jgi:hypothetical protein